MRKSRTLLLAAVATFALSACGLVGGGQVEEQAQAADERVDPAPAPPPPPPPTTVASEDPEFGFDALPVLEKVSDEAKNLKIVTDLITTAAQPTKAGDIAIVMTGESGTKYQVHYIATVDDKVGRLTIIPKLKDINDPKALDSEWAGNLDVGTMTDVDLDGDVDRGEACTMLANCPFEKRYIYQSEAAGKFRGRQNARGWQDRYVAALADLAKAKATSSASVTTPAPPKQQVSGSSTADATAM